MRCYKQSGQMIIILLLIMVIALAIGLSVVSRSISEIATSTNTENASRAFSAAEAGIERLLSSTTEYGQVGTINPSTFNFTNNTELGEVSWDANLPRPTKALEYPPFGKESFAQFWLAHPDTLSQSYDQTSFDIYFGDPDEQQYSTTGGNPQNKPAIEVNVVYWDRDDMAYKSMRLFYDSYDGVNDSSRAPNFRGCTQMAPLVLETNNDTNSSFYCRVRVAGYLLEVDQHHYPVMVRIRMLYSNIAHPVAVQPNGGSSLPLQAKIFKSTGKSGNIQRTLQVFQQKAVMPSLFDYALFSGGGLDKEP